ncbi:hypothetical protein F4680DRAFT_443600 [Xylaria scruposa]|nr:hypothetical protein F4680DRAFT_443600 [Xylaria scruposa]
MFSSCYAVLQTAELLQEILLQLDMRTLLTAAQLVNRQWHALITSSPPLKRALYFDPIAQSSSPATINPLLVEAFPPWYQIAEQLVRKEDFHGLPMAQESRRPAFMNLSASWRHMLVQQPPSLRLGYWTLSHTRTNSFQDFQIQEFPDGLRMGTFYDLPQKWVYQDDSAFNVFWDPRNVNVDWNSSHSHRFQPEKKAEIESFSSQAGNIILLCCVPTHTTHTTRCTCTRKSPDSRFEETFTFAPSKEKQDNWKETREYRQEALTG